MPDRLEYHRNKRDESCIGDSGGANNHNGLDTETYSPPPPAGIPIPGSLIPSFFCSTVAWVLFFLTSAPLIQSRALLFAICTMIVSDLDFVELSSDTNAHIVCHPGPFLGFLGFGDPLLAPCPWAPGKE